MRCPQCQGAMLYCLLTATYKCDACSYYYDADDAYDDFDLNLGVDDDAEFEFDCGFVPGHGLF